ncbi:MAG: hypothetical protein JWQ81_6507 [Amycolatopsis sp.]|jgi:hypothetical protein|uniref:hypothetical protein n=1 Tax=Amycolatopsis sp. TaxID=37632 RepID=UPI0026350AB1|nr:hypothetical protein [Amycolatopsis sp.]MCU1685768.1 hypothetical protein [Amycolatopsis sp.]
MGAKKDVDLEAIIKAARKKLRCPDAWAADIVVHIYNKHNDGWSDAKIAADLKRRSHQDGPHTDVAFVRGVTRQL